VSWNAAGQYFLLSFVGSTLVVRILVVSILVVSTFLLHLNGYHIRIFLQAFVPCFPNISFSLLFWFVYLLYFCVVCTNRLYQYARIVFTSVHEPSLQVCMNRLYQWA
jgi:hypothetical protein